jgi:hypothetical protein
MRLTVINRSNAYVFMAKGEYKVSPKMRYIKPHMRAVRLRWEVLSECAWYSPQVIGEYSCFLPSMRFHGDDSRAKMGSMLAADS